MSDEEEEVFRTILKHCNFLNNASKTHYYANVKLIGGVDTSPWKVQ